VIPSSRKVLEALQKHRIVPVELTAAEVEHYYEGFSNGVLWPLFHAFPDKIRLEMDQDWDTYVAVNKRFAQATAARSGPGDSVWIHDYHLMLVPQLLRELRPDLRIGFFLHFPFPTFEAFRVLPWREALLQGVLGADLVGFQTREDTAHFAHAVEQLLRAEPAETGLWLQGRHVRLGTYGISIDAQAFSRSAASPAVAKRVAELRRDLGGRTLILGVDRLDYTKGIPQRLLALERHLERHPDQRDRFLLLQIAVPSRERVPAYIEYRKQVDQLAARINGRFGLPDRVPIHLLYQSFPFEGVVALYRAADVMLVTSLRDGMNLVAKEFCATRGDDSGVLILSEFAGAAQELREAIQVNPYDTGALANALDTALRMPREEIRQRMHALRERVAIHDVHRWAEAFVHDLEHRVAAPDLALATGAGRGTDTSAPSLGPLLGHPRPDRSLRRLARFDAFHGLANLHAHLEFGVILGLGQGGQVLPAAQFEQEASGAPADQFVGIRQGDRHGGKGGRIGRIAQVVQGVARGAAHRHRGILQGLAQGFHDLLRAHQAHQHRGQAVHRNMGILHGHQQRG
jgi:trehalose 6-phosphate synthase/phosphatase